MSTIELRNSIIQHLSKIEDTSFLNAIKTIVESRITSDYYELNDFELGRVEEARQDLLKNKTISNDNMQKEIGEWLKEG
jgi:hypothetical protein